MTMAANCAITVNSKFQLHIDCGANRSITADTGLLINFRNIKPYKISGGNKDNVAMVYIGVRYLPWQTPDGTTLLVKCYYSGTVTDTIISPSDIVVNQMGPFSPKCTKWLVVLPSTNATNYHPENNTRIHTSIVNPLNLVGLYELFHA